MTAKGYVRVGGNGRVSRKVRERRKAPPSKGKPIKEVAEINPTMGQVWEHKGCLVVVDEARRSGGLVDGTGEALLQSSQMVSRSRSCRRSAPQTLHRLRLSLRSVYPPDPPRMVVNELGTSDAPRRRLAVVAASAASAAAFNCAMRSSSRASFSASGMSGIVSRDEMLGLRERRLVGVEGTEMDDTEPDWPG